MMTYKRSLKLAKTLEEINRLPFLHSVFVYWNDMHDFPDHYPWPKIHVPVHFMNATQNSLNNRFLPSELIKTDAVFSMDDDLIVGWKDILFAYA